MTRVGPWSTSSFDSTAVPLTRSFQSISQNDLAGVRRVVLAVSGGADSVALLRLFHACWPGIESTVACFDHRTRESSAADVQFVAELARRLGLNFQTAVPPTPIDGTGGRSWEGAARDARYAFLTQVARDQGAMLVLTAHTLDDQVETVLHRIARGTGLKGLAGMAPRRPLTPEIDLYRPLLSTTRREIEAYLDQIEQSYRHDSTNDDDRWTRNWIRHELLPMMRERLNPEVDAAIIRLAELARGNADCEDLWLVPMLRDAVDSATSDRIVFRQSVLARLPAFPASAVVRRAIEEAGWPMRRVSRATLDGVVRTASIDQHQQVDLPGGLRAMRIEKRDTLELIRRSEGVRGGR